MLAIELSFPLTHLVDKRYTYLLLNQKMIGERRLWINVVNGDEKSWKRFISEYSSFIYAVIVRYTDDYDEKMSIYLHILEKLKEKDFLKLRQFQFRSALSTWLTVVSRNLTLDYLRGQYGRDFRYKKIFLSVNDKAIPKTEPVNDMSPETLLLKEEKQRKVEQMRTDLRKVFCFLDQRETLLLKLIFFRGMKIKEAGKLLRVRSVYRYLRQTLAKAKLLLLEHSSLDVAEWQLFFEGEWA